MDNCTPLVSLTTGFYHENELFSNYHHNNHVTIVFTDKTVEFKGVWRLEGVNSCCEYQGDSFGTRLSD